VGFGVGVVVGVGWDGPCTEQANDAVFVVLYAVGAPAARIDDCPSEIHHFQAVAGCLHLGAVQAVVSLQFQARTGI
jgi:hypothetical protein